MRLAVPACVTAGMGQGQQVVSWHNLWRSPRKKSLSKPVSFTEPQIFINHCLLTKIYVERGETHKWRERERERERESEGEREAGRITVTVLFVVYW